MSRDRLSFLLPFSLTCWGALMFGELCVSPACAQTTAPAAAPSAAAGQATAGTARQQAYEKGTPVERKMLSENIGEAGSRRYARSKGWTPLFDGKLKGIPQGPDQVYRLGDMVHVVESKGNRSPLSSSYGYVQGSSENAVLSAKQVLASSKASPAQRSAAKAVLEAAAKGKMQVHVVRTSHLRGGAPKTVLEKTVNCSDEAARLARSALDDLRHLVRAVPNPKTKAPKIQSAVKTKTPYLPPPRGPLGPGGGVLRNAGKVAGKVAGKAFVPVAVAVDGGLRVSKGRETERRFEAGEISVQEREIDHAGNVAGMVGGWGGALAGAKLGALGGGAAGSFAPGPGTIVGGVVGGAVGGVAGYFGGEAAAEATAKWTVRQVHSAGRTVTGSVKSAWSGTRNGVASALNWVRGK